MTILLHPFCNRLVLFFLFIAAINLKSYGQTEEEIKQLKELQNRTRKIYDSAYNRAELTKIRNEYLDIISKSKSFSAFTIGYEISKADIKGLNADLETIDFTSMRDRFGAIVFGYSRMNKRVTGNLLFTVTPGNTIENEGYIISLRGGGASFDKGYAFISTDKFILHGFAGFGWQYHTIKQTKKNNNAAADPLFDLLPDKFTGKVHKNILHGSVGFQFDANTVYRKVNNFGLQTGIRFSYNPVFINGKYTDDNEDESTYKPIIHWRTYNISLLVKLFSKTYFRK